MKPIQIKSNEIEKPKEYNNNKFKKNKKNYHKNDNRKNNQ